MAEFVFSTMTVQQGTIRNYTYNTDNGYAAALRFSTLSSDGQPPSLFNHGEMRYSWSGGDLALFITFDTANFWSNAIVANYGIISAIAPNASQTKALYASSWSPDLYNAGTIIAEAKVSALGFESWDATLTVTNATGGSIEARAQENAFGLYLPNGGVVENAGRIVAHTTGGAGKSIGSYGISSIAGSGSIHNTGLIQASDGDASTKYAIAIAFWDGGTCPIVNDGTLRGDYAIFEANGGNASILNNGTMEGDVGLGVGDDVLRNNGAILGRVDLGADNDIYDGQFGAVTVEVVGGDGYDRLNGGAGAERLLGGTGYDRLNGGNGGDDLDGGADRDDFIYTAVTQSTDAGRDRIRNFQTGLDTIELRYLSVGSIGWVQQSDGSGTYNLVSAVTANGTLSIRVDGALAMSDFVLVQDLQLNGTAASDVLTGGAGNDILNGLGGADQMAGKEGDDLYFVDDAGDAIVEAAAGFYETALDTVAASVNYVLTAGAYVETLRAADLGAVTPLSLTGNALDQTIVGNAGANILEGGGGADLLDVDGNFSGEANGDAVREAIGGGYDIVRARGNYSLTPGAEVELLASIDDSAVTEIILGGNEFGQTLRGNAGANGLYSGGGNDIIIGGLGRDTMDGGSGSDVFLYLDAGESVSGTSDLIFLGPDDIVDLRAVGALSIVIAPYDGWIVDFPFLLTGYYATIQTAGGTTMPIRIVGAPVRANFLLGTEKVGTAGDDTLVSTLVDDLLIGKEGNDTYFVDGTGDGVIERAGEGYDVLAASVSYILNAGAHVELMTTGWIEGTAAINLAGNELDQQIWGNGAANIISGSDGDDTLFGFGGADTLLGNAGKDVFFGGAGANDSLYGGLGDDTYFADDGGDVIVEVAGEGQDVAASSVDYVLGAGVSVELMTTGWIGGTATINLTGNALGNEIWGNDGINALSGAAGSDALIGFGGSDRLDGGTGLDLLVGGTGQDSFAFTSALIGADADLIADFSAADDTILLDDAVFAGLVTGALNANAFVTGTAALDADDRIIYDAATGKLYFDADGNGAGAAIQFATLSGNPVLTASDFAVF